MSLGDWVEAEKEFRDVLSRRESNPSGLIQLGATLIAQKRLTEAEQPLNEAIRLDPNLSEGWYQRGILYLEFGQVESALSDFETASNRDYHHLNALLKIAAIHHGNKSWELAEAAWRNVLDVEPNHQVARRRIQEAFDGQTDAKKAAVLSVTGNTTLEVEEDSEPFEEDEEIDETDDEDIPDFEFGFGDL